MPEKSVNITSWEPVSQHTLGLKVNMGISNLEGFRRPPSECELLTINIYDIGGSKSAKLF